MTNQPTDEAAVDIVAEMRSDAVAYRESVGANDTDDMFTLAYQWQDKKHRHVYDLCGKLEPAANEIETLRAQLTAATRRAEQAEAENAALKHDLERQMTIANTECERAEQAERMLAKESLIERTAISAFLKHQAESRWLSQCTGRVALIAAAYAVAGEQHSSFKTMCIGCDMPIADKEYVVDCNGETGCPSCFTDDGSGECWFDTIRSAASGEQG